VVELVDAWAGEGPSKDEAGKAECWWRWLGGMALGELEPTICDDHSKPEDWWSLSLLR
jgi:hypothetical protein